MSRAKRKAAATHTKYTYVQLHKVLFVLMSFGERRSFFNFWQIFKIFCCAARGHALAVWLRLVPRRPNSLRPWRNITFTTSKSTQKFNTELTANLYLTFIKKSIIKMWFFIFFDRCLIVLKR